MTKGLLLDSNLLCLLAVGRTSADVTKHPRLRAFDETDLAKLLSVLDRFADLVLCPHVLAETSNLLAYRQTAQQSSDWHRSLGEVVKQASERSAEAVISIEDHAFTRLGLTDAVLLMLASDQRLTLLSDDLPLHLEAARRGLHSINYSYLRDGAISLDDI